MFNLFGGKGILKIRLLQVLGRGEMCHQPLFGLGFCLLGFFGVCVVLFGFFILILILHLKCLFPMGSSDTAEILRKSEELSDTAWEKVFVFSHSTGYFSLVTVFPMFLELFSWKVLPRFT